MAIGKKFFRLTIKEKNLFVQATIFCVAIKLMVLLLPIKRYRKLLGNQNEITDSVNGEKELQLINEISRAIIRSRKIIPWKSQCLTEAICAKVLLRNRGLKSTLYLGVNKDNDKMIAHAWLKCGDAFITGRKGSGQFTVVSTFA